MAGASAISAQLNLQPRGLVAYLGANANGTNSFVCRSGIQDIVPWSEQEQPALNLSLHFRKSSFLGSHLRSGFFFDTSRSVRVHPQISGARVSVGSYRRLRLLFPLTFPLLPLSLRSDGAIALAQQLIWDVPNVTIPAGEEQRRTAAAATAEEAAASIGSSIASTEAAMATPPLQLVRKQAYPHLLPPSPLPGMRGEPQLTVAFSSGRGDGPDHFCWMGRAPGSGYMAPSGPEEASAEGNRAHSFASGFRVQRGFPAADAGPDDDEGPLKLNSCVFMA
ncbi:hypothetical protein AK812_SmicGene2901 [Symbiodinium microadriaticum]|uniref:Uncharacterized protein n=1 Tax=Symbiodinium microadriaticum TaxID=2951 RepID=A0A1Q9F051_SYMMI|nr:hypothetical protein AK812_SmicGene2901 [Symbiodinium microadriaticum]